MATQIQPENSNDSQPPSENPANSNNQPADTTPPQNPPAPSTTNPTNVNDLNLLAFRTAERERQRLEEENRALQARLQNEKRPDYSSYNERFLTEPAVATAEITRNIVQEEIRNAFAPLQQDFTRMSRATQYRDLKDQVRQVVPNFAAIESYVDAIMANQEPTVQNMQVAIPLAIGQLAMAGQSWQNTPANNNPAPTNQLPAPTPVPAQLPPSPPAPPRPVNQNATRPLSELEKRVARENNMTEEEYREFRDMDEKAVATSNVGRPQNPPKP